MELTTLTKKLLKEVFDYEAKGPNSLEDSIDYLEKEFGLYFTLGFIDDQYVGYIEKDGETVFEEDRMSFYFTEDEALEMTLYRYLETLA